MDTDDFTVSLPLSELIKLLDSCRQIPSLSERVEFISNRIDGLSYIYPQILDELKDIKKSL